MNKTDLIKKMAQEAGSTLVDAGKMVDAFVETVSAAMKKKDHVTLVGFGTFKVIDRKAKTGRNPKTGQKIQIKAKKAPKFVPGTALKDKVK